MDAEEHGKRLLEEVLKTLEGATVARCLSVLIHSVGAIIAKEYDIVHQEEILNMTGDKIRACVYLMREDKEVKEVH